MKIEIRGDEIIFPKIIEYSRDCTNMNYIDLHDSLLKTATKKFNMKEIYLYLLPYNESIGFLPIQNISLKNLYDCYKNNSGTLRFLLSSKYLG